MESTTHSYDWLAEINIICRCYIDIGLRVYNGTRVVKIAGEPLGVLTSPLRIAKNGNIYGVILVDPGDDRDSGVRIQTSSGVRALMEYQE